jgi:hypothetical protein
VNHSPLHVYIVYISSVARKVNDVNMIRRHSRSRSGQPLRQPFRGGVPGRRPRLAGGLG